MQRSNRQEAFPRRLLAVAIIVFTYLPVTASHNLGGPKWCNQSPTYNVNEFVPYSFHSAIQNAETAWNQEPSAFTFNWGGTTTRSGNYHDQWNLIDYASLLDPNEGARTFIHLAPFEADTIEDVDTVLNSTMRYSWQPGPDCPNSSEIDVHVTMLHEFGHWLQLTHSGNPEDRMFDSITVGDCQRFLSPHDGEGISAIYPPGSTCRNPPPSRGPGCHEPSLGIPPRNCPEDFRRDPGCQTAVGGQCVCAAKYAEIDDCSVLEAAGVQLLPCDADDVEYETPVESEVAGLGIALMRGFRSKLNATNAGRAFVDQYTTHNQEVYDRLAADPSLRRKTKIALNNFMSNLRYYLFKDVGGQDTVLTQVRIDEIRSLVSDLKDGASPALQQDLDSFMAIVSQQEGKLFTDAVTSVLLGQ